MKRLLLFTLAATMVTGAFAQDLDTTNIRDQFNTGNRGNNTAANTGTTGSAPDGSEFADYTGTDASTIPTTAIRYINTWASGAIESPVLNITAPQTNPDRAGITLPAIIPNTRPGADDGNTAILIGDNGGHNGLYFGDSDDSDYFAAVDIFCPVSTVGAGFEVAGLVVRAARNNDPNMTDFTFNPDRAGSYAIFYDYQNSEIKFVQWHTGNVTADIQNRLASTYTQYGTTIDITENGWHTFKIVCDGSDITFSVDESNIETISDTTFTFGRPGIYYREANVTSAAERQGIFDNLRAGPASTANVYDWNLY